MGVTWAGWTATVIMSETATAIGTGTAAEIETERGLRNDGAMGMVAPVRLPAVEAAGTNLPARARAQSRGLAAAAGWNTARWSPATVDSTVDSWLVEDGFGIRYEHDTKPGFSLIFFSMDRGRDRGQGHGSDMGRRVDCDRDHERDRDRDRNRDRGRDGDRERASKRRRHGHGSPSAIARGGGSRDEPPSSSSRSKPRLGGSRGVEYSKVVSGWSTMVNGLRSPFSVATT